MTSQANTPLPPRSPCTGVCLLNPQQICLGCHRSMSEIGRWSSASNEEKRLILAEVNQRRFASLTKSVDPAANNPR